MQVIKKNSIPFYAFLFIIEFHIVLENYIFKKLYNSMGTILKINLFNKRKDVFRIFPTYIEILSAFSVIDYSLINLHSSVSEYVNFFLKKNCDDICNM